MVFDEFDEIRIINLAHRLDRRDEMKQQLRKVGLIDDRRVEFFPAFSPEAPGRFSSKGAHGCYLSHLSILRAADAKSHSVLILEDDCDFRSTILNYEMPPCDIFYGGFLSDDPKNLQDSNIIGSHFMGFSNQAVGLLVAYLENYLEDDFKGDPRGMADPTYNPRIRPGTDGMYVWFRRRHPELKTVFADLSKQRASKTDIGRNKWFDRAPIIRHAVGLARRIRNGIASD